MLLTLARPCQPNNPFPGGHSNCNWHGVVLLRPHNFQQRDVHYILRYKPRPMSYDWRRVPPHMRASHWRQLLMEPLMKQLTDSLLHVRRGRNCTSGTVGHVVNAVLGKFEDPRYVHVCELVEEDEQWGGAGGGGAGSKRRRRGGGGRGRSYKRHEGSGAYGRRGGDGTDEEDEEGEKEDRVLLFELPRFGVEFELCGGELRSRDYSGYRLRREQQLVAVAQAGAGAAEAGGEGAGMQAQEQGRAGGGGGARQQKGQQQEQQGGDGGGAAVLSPLHLPPAIHRVSYTLPEFRQYLILERVPDGLLLEVGVRRMRDELVLVPVGLVEKVASEAEEQLPPP